jgi:hypothetical protein
MQQERFDVGRGDVAPRRACQLPTVDPDAGRLEPFRDVAQFAPRPGIAHRLAEALEVRLREAVRSGPDRHALGRQAQEQP